MTAPEHAQIYAKILGTLDRVATEIIGLPIEQRAAAFLLARQNYEAVLRDRGVQVGRNANRFKIDAIMLELQKTAAGLEKAAQTHRMKRP